VGSIDSSLGSQVTFGIAVIVSRGRAFVGTGEFRVGESAAAGELPGLASAGGLRLQSVSATPEARPFHIPTVDSSRVEAAAAVWRPERALVSRLKKAN